MDDNWSNSTFVLGFATKLRANPGTKILLLSNVTWDPSDALSVKLSALEASPLAVISLGLHRHIDVLAVSVDIDPIAV